MYQICEISAISVHEIEIGINNMLVDYRLDYRN